MDNGLKPLICTGCGGHIDRDTLTCRSCGTAYRLDDDFKPVRIEVRKGDIKVVQGCVQLPREFVLEMGADDMTRGTRTDTHKPCWTNRDFVSLL